MILFNGTPFTCWSAVKYHWKRGQRGSITGTPCKGGSLWDYHTGDGFMIYPQFRKEGDACSLDYMYGKRTETAQPSPYRHLGRAAMCSTTNPFGNGIL